MDSAIAAQAEAVLIAGFVASIAQERGLGDKLSGRSAFLATVAISLVIGIAAVARVGGLAVGAPQQDPLAFAIEVLKVAAVVLAASQAAYRIFTKPIAAPAGA